MNREEIGVSLTACHRLALGILKSAGLIRTVEMNSFALGSNETCLKGQKYQGLERIRLHGN